MDHIIVALQPYTVNLLVISLVLNIVLFIAVRYLAIDPGFRIKTRAAGELSMWLAFGPRDIVYGDIDGLGLINDALTSGRTIGHDRFNRLMQWTCSQLRATDTALVYGGDELRFLVAPGTWHGFCERLQAVLRSAPLSCEERMRLVRATGRDYISITLAGESSRGVLTHRAALSRAKQRVQAAKPKNAIGQRGQIIEVAHA